MEEDALAEEIARLEAELEINAAIDAAKGTVNDDAVVGRIGIRKPTTATTTPGFKNSLQRLTSQRDYVVTSATSNNPITINKYLSKPNSTSDDELSYDEISYDEITVNTTDEITVDGCEIEIEEEEENVEEEIIFEEIVPSSSSIPFSGTNGKNNTTPVVESHHHQKEEAAEPQLPEQSRQPDLSKYYQMLQIGLPDAAVQHTMTQDGIDPKLIEFRNSGIKAPTGPKKIHSSQQNVRSSNNTNRPQQSQPSSPTKKVSTAADDAAASKLQAEIQQMEADIKAAKAAAKKTPSSPKKKNAPRRVVKKKPKQTNGISDAERQLQFEIERMEDEIQKSSPVKKPKTKIVQQQQRGKLPPLVTTSPPPANKQKQQQQSQTALSTAINDDTTKTNPVDVSKYKQMLKIGLPLEAIHQTMSNDGIPPSLLPNNDRNFVPLHQQQQKRTITATIPTSSNATDPIYGKYYQMMRIGLPEGAIRNALDRDGVDSSGMNFTSKTPSSATTTKTTLSKKSGRVVASSPQRTLDPVYAKYQQMAKLGLPEGAILNAMERDGIDPEGMDFSTTKQPPSSKSTGSSTSRTAASQSSATSNARGGADVVSASTIPPKSDQNPAYAKYYQMIKIGLPEGAVRVAITRDGIDPCMVLGGEPAPPKPKPKAPKPPPPPVQKASSDDPKYSKYFTMLDIGLPNGAVLNALDRDGVDPAAVFGSNVPVCHMRNGPPPKPQTEAERITAEIKRMEAAIANETAQQQNNEAMSMFNLVDSIAEAATHREQRIEENNGELYMQDVAPEVEAQHITPQLSTSMAETISSMAKARDKRLDEGGEKRMRKVEILEKSEYKQQFSNIVDDAAAMGRLTRLDEHAVEATAIEKTQEQEWRSNGLMAIQWRSSHMSVIHEAARAGNAQKLPETVTSNCEELKEDGWDPDSNINGKKLSPRMQQLMQLNSQAGEGQQKVDKLVLGRKEQTPKEDSLLIRPMQAYGNDNTKLPRKAPPRVDPQKNAERLSKMTRESMDSGRPMIDISVCVAEKAWERRARLDRPGGMPKIKEVCPCPYCHNASPFQTFAYRELDRKRRERHLKLQRGEPVDESVEDESEVEDETTAVETEAQAIERKRIERKKAREEKRKLQQDADAEAAANPPSLEATQSALDKPDDMEQFAGLSPVDAGCRCIIM